MNKTSHLFVLALVLIQAGCSIGKPTPPSEFYVLSPEPATTVSGRTAPTRALSLALGPVSLPDLLDRPQIVTRPDPNRVALDEFNRWGGDLKGNLTQVLTQNLMNRLNTDSILSFPWSGSGRPDFQLAVRFFRFDGTLGDAAYLEGVWHLLDGREGCELVARRFEFAEKPGGPAHADFVRAMSVGIGKLSDEIARQVALAQPGC